MYDIYFDSAATTKPCQAAVEAAVRAMEEYGNPSSTHFRGMAARRIIENARSIVASALGCGEDEFIFTGSGSESNNLAVIGAARARKRRSDVIVSTDSEHPSIEKPLEYLESEGFHVIRLSTKGGKFDIAELKEALKQKVALVTIMRANNETETLYDIAAVRREIDNSGCGALFHCDAVQGFLKTPNRGE
jgi:cysteine desulfurase